MEEVGLKAIFDTRDFNRGLSDYLGGIGRANRAAERGAEQGFNFAHALEVAVGNAFVEIAKLAVDAAIKLGNLFVGPIRDAISVEAAFAGVIKTTDGLVGSTGDLTEMGKDMRQSFRDLAKEIPVTVEELMGIGEIGGQLGIAEEDLIEFTEVIAALGVSTNLTSEEAAISIAQFGNVAGMTTDELESFASSIVYLGNNTETTEKDIMNFASRIVGAGTIAGLAESEIAGIAAAFSSVGVTAEAGGTAVSKVMMKMNTAVASGSEEVEKFAEVAGISGQEFADLWEEDAASAFTMFVEGLGEAGGDAVTLLDDLELKDSRLVEAFLKAGQAGNKLQESIDDSNDAFREGNALTDEANSAYGTTEAQLQLLQNNMRDFGLSIADSVLPYLNPFIEALIGLAEKYGPGIAEAFGNIIEKAEPFIQFLLDGIENGDLFEQIFSGIKDIFSGDMADIVGQIGDAMKNLLKEDTLAKIESFGDFLKTKVLPPLGLFYGFMTQSLVSSGFASFIAFIVPKILAFSGALTAFISMINPVSIALALLGAVIFKNLGGVSEFFKNVGSVIVEFAKEVGEFLAPMIHNVKVAFADLSEQFSGLVESLEPLLPIVGGALVVVMSILAGVIKGVLGGVAALAAGLMTALGGIIEFVSGFVDLIVGAGELIISVIKGDGKGSEKALKKLGKGLDKIVSGIMKAITGIIGGAISAIIKIIEGFITGTIDFFKNLKEKLVGHSIVPDMMNAIERVIENILDSVKRFVSRWIDNIESFFSDLSKNIKSTWNNLWNTVQTKAQNITDSIKTTIDTWIANLKLAWDGFVANLKQKWNNMWNGFSTGLATKFESIKTAISEGLMRLIEKFNEFMESFKQKGRDIVNNIVSGVQETISNLIEIGATIVSNIAQGIKDNFIAVVNAIKEKLNGLASSLKDSLIGAALVGAKIVSKIADGIKNLWDQAGGVLKTIMAKFSSFLSDLRAVNAFSGIISAGNEIVEKLKEGINNAWTAFVGWIKDKLIGWFGEGDGGDFDSNSVSSPSGGFDLQNTGTSMVDRSRTINVEVNPTYTNMQSEAGIYHDVLAALQAVGS